MTVHQPRKNLYLVDLDLPLKGFRQFISSWIYISEDLTLVVDPGPRCTLPVLVEALQKLGVHKIDYILLTHIHIDHAGGAGLLLKTFPDARFICHRKGIRHMIAPARLWQESHKTLGHVAEAYGEIEPVPKECISFQGCIAFGQKMIRGFETPGHASHHLSYQIDDLLFAGEVAGITYPLDQGLYLRVASPPGFNYDLYRDSLRRAAALDVSHICFSHYGYRSNEKTLWTVALKQLDHWLATVEKHHREGSQTFAENAFHELLESDPALAHFRDLPDDIQTRERYFALNGIRGIRNYILSR